MGIVGGDMDSVQVLVVVPEKEVMPCSWLFVVVDNLDLGDDLLFGNDDDDLAFFRKTRKTDFFLTCRRLYRWCNSLTFIHSSSNRQLLPYPYLSFFSDHDSLR